MSTREILSWSIAGMPSEQEVFVNAGNLREVDIDPGEGIPDGRPCGVLVGQLREKLATPVAFGIVSPAAVEDAATVGQTDDDNGEFKLSGDTVGQI